MSDLRKTRRAATDGDWIAERARLVDETQRDRVRGQFGPVALP